MRLAETHWTVARTQADVDEAQHLRWQVAAEDLGIAGADSAGVARDVSPFDNLTTTFHVLVRCGERTVGTARLAVENLQVARRTGTAFGFEMEREFDLAGLRDLGHPMAEIARVFIRRDWRASTAVPSLYEGLYVTSQQLGVRYWMGAVDCQTSSRDEALRMRAVLGQRGLVDPRYRVTPRHDGARGTLCGEDVPDPSVLAWFGERSPATPCRLASTLVSFTRRLAAKCVGTPSRHPVFPRMVMPMLTDLDELPLATQKRFDPSVLALRSPGSPAPGQQTGGTRHDDTEPQFIDNAF